MTKKETKKLTVEQSAMVLFEKLALCREVCDGKPIVVSLVFNDKGHWIIQHVALVAPQDNLVIENLMPGQKAEKEVNKAIG